MIPVLLDTATGERRTADGFDFSVYWWTEGNGSCDCNRAIVFGRPVRMGICSGYVRFLAVDVTGDLEGWNKGDVLAEMNRDYPAELLAQYMPPTGGEPCAT